MMSKEFQWIGKPTLRYDGVARVTGHALYADDLRLPGMLVGKILRSPHAHARIRSIDTSRAEALPGVKAVATGQDAPVTYGILPVSEDEYALAVGKVRFVGDEVAAVAAVDEETALRALSLIEVDYEVLPAIFDPHEAMVREDVKIHEGTKIANIERQASLSFGDVEAGFASADYIREDSFFKGAATHAPLEPHSAMAHFQDGKLTVWTSTQVPHYLQRYLSKVLGLAQDRVRVIKPVLGGGFGGKGEPLPLEFAASILARKSGRPVKITYTREEVFLTHRGRHPMHMKLKTGVKSDGRITALHFESLLDGGSYGSYGVVTLYYSGQLLTGPYVIPAYSFKATRVNTNKPPCGAQRGHGAVQPRFAFEVHLDRIASDLGIDPLDIRLKNAMESDTRTVNELRITSCGFRECLERSAEKSSWKERRGKLPEGRGMGMAGSIYISGAGLPIYFNPMHHSNVRIEVDRSGRVTVFCGASDIGQGSDTMLALVAGEVLGVPPELVRVVSADTDTTPVDLGSYSSRVTFMAGNACHAAATEVRKRILFAVAEEHGVSSEELDLRYHLVEIPGNPPKTMSFAEAAALAEAKGGMVCGSGGYTPPKLAGKYRGGGVGPSPAYSFSAYVAEVDVDRETGVVKVLSLVAAHDLGRALNPPAAEGQVQGAAVMGLAETLFERNDFLNTGQHASPSLLEYKVPTALDVPDVLPILVESVDPEGPFGAKECGEGTLCPAIPAVINAIYDAVGIWLHDAPITPEAVLNALRRQRQKE
ncbi:MAG: molybdopterin-dependent oxidoreductase [Syntrophobacteraceae bacterium]|nr:molybdopterin-dependent oxidoreductase [Syntrophobacteraceae bacterium]